MNEQAKIHYIPKHRCLICDGALHPLWELQNLPASAQDIPTREELSEDHPISLMLCQCEVCGLVQFDEEPVHYYRDVIRAGGGTTTMTHLRHEEYTRLLQGVRRNKESINSGKENVSIPNRFTTEPPTPFKIVEVGCGRGEFLEMWKTLQLPGVENYKGSINFSKENVMVSDPVRVEDTGSTDHAAELPPLHLVGLEHSNALVEQARAAGFDVYEDFPEPGKPFPEGPFDAFVQFNFLEHQPDPRSMLRAIRENLRDGGLGLVTVPSFEYILHYDGYYEFLRDHIANYTEQTLGYLFSANGFEVLSLRIVNRDTIEIIVRKGKGDPSAFKFDGQFVDMTPLKENYAKLSQAVNAHIAALSAEGGSLALWGAGHQGFTLASTTELGGKVRYIIDSADFKQGKFTPASHIPIVPPAHFHEDPVTEILIVAPGYTDEIAGIIRKDFGPDVKILVLRTEKLEEYSK